MPIQYDSNGIITQNLTEILDERESALKPVMGEDFVIDKTTPIGNMELADANSELAIHELIAWLIPNMIDANTATGYFLDCICEKNRIYRKQPEYTKLKLVLNGEPNTSFLSESITVSDNITGIYYVLNEDCSIGENGVYLADFICREYGEYSPLKTSTFEILTPTIGLNEVTLDVENVNIILGRETETDDELRRRRNESVQQTSTSIMASIKANLYSLNGVKNVRYFENDTESTDANGLPLKSFEFVVNGGDENEITDTIFTNKPAGTRAYGTTIIEKKDSENNIYTIGFTKAEKIDIGMDISISTKTLQGVTFRQAIAEAIKNKFDEIQQIGDSVRDYNYYAIITQFNEVYDILDIKFFNTSTPSVKVSSKYEIQNKQVAVLDINNINISITG